jgi:capsular exopolysaccharide synthesis family protein
MSQVFDALRRAEGDNFMPWTRDAATCMPSPQVVREPDRHNWELDQAPQLSSPKVPERVVALAHPDSLAAEKFRVLAMRLRTLQKLRQLKKLLITSALKGDGKSVISANLAATLACRQKTLLIDGDLHQSGLKDVLAAEPLPGLTDWWQGSAPISRFLHRVPELSLWYLPAGLAAERPLDILQSTRMAELLAQIAGWFDWVIIDSPPLVPVADSTVWATQVDGTLLVVRQGKTAKKLLQETLESVENLKLLGIVMNASDDTHPRYYRQYYKDSLKGGPPSTA